MQTKRADQRKHHIIYKTICLATGRWYIGMHSTNDLHDGYIGSGQVLWRSIKKYGKEQHKCEILEHLPDRKSLALREEQILSTELRSDPLCMNVAPGGIGHHPGWYTTSESTKQKLSEVGVKRWERDRSKLRADLDDHIAAFTMTREEILATLVQVDGKLSKNATRALMKLQADKLAGQRETTILAKRERERSAKWSFILSQLKNPEFNDNMVEQIDAYVYQRTIRPLCKCGKPLTFFRFGQPYATYCGARCQMLGSKRTAKLNQMAMT